MLSASVIPRPEHADVAPGGVCDPPRLELYLLENRIVVPRVVGDGSDRRRRGGRSGVEILADEPTKRRIVALRPDGPPYLRVAGQPNRPKAILGRRRCGI